MPTIDSKGNEAKVATSKNFTPLNEQKMDAKAHAKLNTMIIVIAVITALILGFIMISLFKTS